jgi:uncharacterized protein YndB with AHSA1/START domain
MYREKGKTEMIAGELVITRIFNAPRELVFKAFTEKEHLAHWWGPAGCKLKVIGLDLRPGGFFHYSMKYPEGAEMWGRFEYREIDAPGKIVFTNSFADEKGNIIRPPFNPAFPLKILNTWTFLEEKGKTTLTLRGKPVEPTEEERSAFEDLFGSMREGFSRTFNKLEEYLPGISK